MSTNLDIILRVKADNTGVFVQVADQIEKVGDAVIHTDAKLKSASGGMRAFGENLDRATTRARSGLAGLAQMGDLVGANLDGITRPAMQAANAIGDLASAGLAMGPIGLILAGVGGALVLVTAHLQGVQRQMVENVKTNDAYLKSLGRYASESNAVVEAIERVANAQVLLNQSQTLSGPGAGGTARAIAAKVAAENYERERAALEELIAPMERMSAFMADYEEKSIKLEHTTSVLTIRLNEQAEAWELAAVAANRYITEVGDTRGQAIEDLRAGARSIAEMNTDAWFAKNEFKEGVGWVEKIPKASAAATAAVRKLEQAAAAIRAKFQGLVEGALSPTEADPNMGNSWDEARKRFEAFASGTDTGAYGDKFKKMFEGLKMDAKDAAAAFKDFSLFANPENMKLVDFDAVTASVERQLMGIVGKANLVKEAVTRVWAGLSDTAKSGLAEQGIGSAEEAIDQMVDPAEAAKKEVLGLSAAVSGIPTMVTTVFKAEIESAKSAVQELADFLDEFINAYGTVNVSAQGEFSGPPNNSGGDSNNNGSSGARATGGYVGRGMYRLGEAGREYVLPHGLVSYIERILGGKITNPDQIGWLVGALGGGAGETRNQLQLWASGMAGWGVDAPANSDKWTKKIYDRYAKTYGADALPASVGAAGGSGGGGDGGGSIDLSQTNALLESIDRKLGAILGNMGRGNDMLAIGAQLRIAQGLT